MTWRAVAFAHWAVDPAAVRQRIPDLYCRELQVQALAPRLATGRVALSRGTGEVVAATPGV